jgi:hypothetical protein
MKTKVFFLVVVISLMSIRLSAQVQSFTLQAGTNNVVFNVCETVYDSVVVYKVEGDGGCDFVKSGVGVFSQDSVIITPATQGEWSYASANNMIYFTVNFTTIAPTPDPFADEELYKCPETSMVILGQTDHQPDFTYLWGGGETSPSIQLLTPGPVFVTVTGACGEVTDYMEIMNWPSPNPELGADIVSCNGNTVTLNPGTFAGYEWSTMAITPTLDVTTGGTYSVEVTDDNGCKTEDEIDVEFVFAPEIEICYVEFDTITHKNRIVWAAAPVNADDINIYSEISTDVYSLIGSVPASQTSYIDMNSNPQNMSYSYKISISDTCENEGSQSAYHKTITLLSAYDQPTNTYGFTWSAYEGISVANYLIYGINASNAVFQIASVPGNTYFYNYSNPSPTFVKYFVGFYTEDCGSKSEYMVKSNLVNSNSSSNIEIAQNAAISIYPNPAISQINIITDQNITEIIVYSITGQEMLKLGNTKTVDVSGLAAGNYSLKIVTESGVAVERVVVE